MTETEVERLSGVYSIRNVVSGKRYVGSTCKGFRYRWRDHRSKLSRNKHSNKHLQAAWNKYGRSKFVFEILEACHPDKCLAREQVWIDHFRAADPRYGYNGRPTAESNRGKKFGPLSDKHRASISASLAGRPNPAVYDKTAREKMGSSTRGKSVPRERIAKMLKTRPPGWSHTTESRLKMSVARAGFKMSEEQKQKISQAKKGKKQLDRRRPAPFSDEHRANISRAIKKAWDLRRNLS